MAISNWAAIPLAGALVLCGSWAPESITSHGGGGSYGFVLTDLSPAMHKGPERVDCPNGRALNVMEAYLATQPAAERARLLKPENAEELEAKYKGPFVERSDGRNICTHPELFDRPPQRTVKGPIAYGFDLDGDGGAGPPAPGTCPHENFKDPRGAVGIDNQYYRATGCNNFWRGGEGPVLGGQIETYRKHRSAGPNTVVIVLRRVDDWRNDDDVEFILANSPDSPLMDGQRKFLERASYTLTENSNWRNVTRAQIHDGVLTTDPIDVRLFLRHVRAPDELDLRRVRFRLTMQPNGDLKGLAGAYWPLSNVMAQHRDGGTAYATIAGVECASVYKTLTLLADGDRDPTTGQCRSISVAFNVEAVPAFVFERGGSLVARTAELAKR